MFKILISSLFLFFLNYSFAEIAETNATKDESSIVVSQLKESGCCSVTNIKLDEQKVSPFTNVSGGITTNVIGK